MISAPSPSSAAHVAQSASPLVTRENREDAFQFTQEVRLASPPGTTISLNDSAAFRWQAGVFLFTQNYDQEATNTFGPMVVDPSLTFPISQTSPLSELDDVGVGLMSGFAPDHGKRQVT